jgi:DivIVA domain-containing protein
MPLTPEDVSNKRFTPTRLTQGYDMGEVDQFLDEVEAELGRLLRENEELRARGDGAGSTAATSTDGASTLDGASPAAQAAPDTSTTSDSQPAASAEPTTATTAAATSPAASPAPTTAATPLPSETLKVTTVADASSAATRLLEIATRSADELVTEARTEAERIVAESRGRAEQLETDARTRSQQVEVETQERRRQLFGDLETERHSLEGEVENLRSFEREYRARLKTYFEQQLSALDGSGESGLLSDAPSTQA